MIDLKDLTFTIPIRIDSNERLRNLGTTLLYLTKHFDTNIMVYEESKDPVVENMLKNNNLLALCSYKHIKTDNPIFHRTHLLNQMALASQTPYIANYDADVLLKVNQYKMAIDMLRSNQSDMVFPYNGKFIDILGETLKTTIHDLSIEYLQESDGNLIHPNSLGGAIFWNKSKFFQIGGENENFKSWGWEDNERISRTTKLGLNIYRVAGCLFHMNHPVSQNSSNTKHQAYFDNQKEYIKVHNMSPTELMKYISTWEWNQQ